MYRSSSHLPASSNSLDATSLQTTQFSYSTPAILHAAEDSNLQSTKAYSTMSDYDDDNNAMRFYFVGKEYFKLLCDITDLYDLVTTT